MSAERRTSRWRALRGNVWRLGLVSLWTDFSSEMMNPLLPVFVAGLVPLGWAAFWVGLTEGAAEATASLLKAYAGGLSDRLGRRKGLALWGYGLSSLLRPLTGLAGAAWQVLALKVGDRVGKGLRTAPRDALLGASADPAHRGLAFGFHRAMDHTGAVLGPLAALGLLALLLPATPNPGQELSALRLLFLLAVVPGALSLLTLGWGVREIPPPPRAAGPARSFRGLPGRLWAFVGIAALFALGNSSDLFLLLYAREAFGLSLAGMVGLWILLHLSKAASGVVFGALSDRVGRRPLILAGWLLYAGVYLAMAWAASLVQLAVLLGIYGLYYGLTEGAEKALVLDLAGQERSGSAFGLYHGAVGLSALPASLLFGVFWIELGPRWAFGVGAGLAGLAALLLGLFLAVGTRPGPSS
ncbi:MAG TPA: MFS transporter [Myxococcota bacterium]|nr:MFS transporter [Myxococcota bacterium]HRY93443.1 MFS transporter [Myxococcota bacterium]HSA22116.1 MFS transporter [Myxococcota bacterium]